MASKKNVAVQPSKPVSGKKNTAASKVADKQVKPAKKVVKAEKKPSVPVKKVAAAKSSPVEEKTAAKKKSSSDNNKVSVKNTDSKKDNTKKPTAKKEPAAVAKKEAPAKKAVAAKIEPPAKKAPASKKAEPAQPEAKPKGKVAATKEPVKKPASKEAAPVVAATPKKVVASKQQLKTLPVRPSTPIPTPTPTPSVRSTEKKPQVIIAHRKLDNKSKPVIDEEAITPYQPEVYRSILDEPAPPSMLSTVYRYNDEDLAEFKELITSRLEAARKELIYLQGLITRKDEAGTEDTENRFMNMEDGSGAMEREQLAQLASRQIQFMSHLEKALLRIENKTYGVCRVTGKLIDKARLRAVPHATLSIEAKKMMASKQN